MCLEGKTSHSSVPGNQTKNHSGPTTLVINKQLPTTSSIQSACPKVPDDNASTPALPSVQPVNITYPVTVMFGKSKGHLIQHGIVFIHGKSTPYKKMPDTVTAVVSLVLDL